MEGSLRINHDAATPIYLQVQYQLSYLITSGQLVEGQRLPTVRALAGRLGVNTGTVAQAYKALQRQGLVDAAAGGGTWVASTLPPEPDAPKRQRLLTDALEHAIQRGRALGFGVEEVRQRLDALLAAGAGRTPVLLAAPTPAIGRKYATSIERHLGPEVVVHPVTIEDVERREAHVSGLLDVAYFVLTFAGFMRRVEDGLAAFSRASRVLGFTTALQPRTVAALGRLGADERVCVVTQEPFLTLTLDLLAEHAGRGAAGVAVCLDGDDAAADRHFPDADRVVYTFAARDFLDERGVPPGKRLEISFDVAASAVERLRALLCPDGGEARHERDPDGVVPVSRPTG
jgi:DNA-binding transcriptional regulator YhcF (GntR family)